MSNKESWVKYEESEEDKKIYSKSEARKTVLITQPRAI